MSRYKLFAEPDYEKKKQAMKASPKDRPLRTSTSHGYKSIYASVCRKLFETTGWHKGRFPDIQEKIEAMDFGRLKLYDKQQTEFVTATNCFLDSYNDANEYHARRILVNSSMGALVVKKRFKSFKSQSIREIKEFAEIYRCQGDGAKYRTMRLSLVFYNTIMNTYFMHRFPKRIPMDLYDECRQKNGNFDRLYEVKDGCAVLTGYGKDYNRSRSMFRGIYYIAGEEIAWMFTLYFFHMR